MTVAPMYFLQDFRHDDAAIGLLVVFHHGNHYPRQGQAGAVQGMDELGLGIRGGAVADVGPPRLEIAAVGAGADLQPFLTAGRPDLDVVGLGGGKTDVAGAELQDAVGQSQLLADVLGVMGEFLQLVIGGLRLDELVKLHLIELVAALDAARVFAGGHLFPAETGGIGDVVYGQSARRQDFIAVQVGQRYFGGGDEPVVFLGIMVEVIGELGQVAGADHALLLDHVRRIYFW